MSSFISDCVRLSLFFYCNFILICNNCNASTFQALPAFLQLQHWLLNEQLIDGEEGESDWLPMLQCILIALMHFNSLVL